MILPISIKISVFLLNIKTKQVWCKLLDKGFSHNLEKNTVLYKEKT